MQKYFEPFITWLQNLATTMSLELFVVIAGFLEEIIAPIPSPFVMTTAAMLAKALSYSPLQITVLIQRELPACEGGDESRFRCYPLNSATY